MITAAVSRSDRSTPCLTNQPSSRLSPQGRPHLRWTCGEIKRGQCERQGPIYVLYLWLTLEHACVEKQELKILPLKSQVVSGPPSLTGLTGPRINLCTPWTIPISVDYCVCNWFWSLSTKWNCPGNCFRRLSINWNCPDNWFRWLSIDWNCPDSGFRRPSFSWHSVSERFRVLSMNWNCLNNRFRRLSINWKCPDNWFWVLVHQLELSRQLISGAVYWLELSKQLISGAAYWMELSERLSSGAVN